MNIFIFELRQLKNNIIIWTIVLTSLFLALFCLYPAYFDNKDVVINSLSSLPKETLTAMNIDLETLFTPLGFYSFILIYISFLGALQAGILGLRVMINDAVSNASIFILSKPKSRREILRSKLLASIVSLFITHVIYQIISISLMFIIDQSISIYTLILINIGLFFLKVSFFSICLIIGSYIKKPKAILVISIIIIFAFYILSLIENMVDSFILRYINPFSYFKASDILVNGSYNQGFIVATIFIIFFGFNFAYGSFESDDILEV